MESGLFRFSFCVHRILVGVISSFLAYNDTYEIIYGN